MTTEEEAREATDGQEVQAEAVDHLHEQLDNKISSNKEIKGETKLMNSTEEMLRIPDDQVLVEAPSEIKIPSEHDLNGMAPSLNGHVDKLEKISNGQPHENDQNNQELVEDSPDQTSTNPSNKSDEEVTIHSLSRRESASEDTILLKYENEDPMEHGQQNLEGHAIDDSMVQEELKLDNPIEQTADAQQGLESSKATEDMQPANMANIRDVEFVVEAPAGIQSPLEPNIDETTETDEPDKTDDPTHLDHKENFPEDIDGEHTEEVAKVEDQLNKQAENTDADVVQEEISESEKTDVPKIEHADEASIDDQATENKEDTDEEHTEEVAKVEDQLNKQAEKTDADVVQEEIPESEKTDVPKIEHADEASIDDQAAVNEEPALETNGSVSVEAEETCHQSNVVTSEEKAEETCHQSNVVTSEEITPADELTTREPFVDTQEVQNQGSVQEMEGAEAVDTEETVQQSSVAFDEATIPEDQVTATDPGSDFQQVQNVEPEKIKSPGVDEAAEITSQSNVAFAEDADDDKVIPSEPTADIQPAQGLEQEESKNTATAEMDDTSNITDPAVFSNLDQEDDLPTGEPHVKELAEEAVVLSNLDQADSIVASEPHMTELAEEAKDIEATETEDITHQSHVDTPKELPIEDNSTASEPHHDDIQQALKQDSVEVKDNEAAEDQGICHEGTILTPEDTMGDNVTAEGQTCVTQEVQDAESAEEIKDRKAENVAEVSNVAAVNDADQENSVLISEEIAEEQKQGLESEEKSNTEPIETEAGSNQTHAAPYNDSAQEDTATASAAVEITENKDTETEAILPESHVSVSEEPTPEDEITPSEATCNTPGVNIEESTEAIEDDKYTKTEEISDESNEVFAGEAADILESEEMKEAELVEVSETSHQMHAAISQTPTQEHNPTTCESAEVSNVEGTEAQVTPHQSNVTQSEEQATEENTTASEPQILEAEPVQQMKDDEVTEPEGISQQSSVSAFEDSVPEEDVTTKEPAYDDKEIQTDEPELIKEHDDVKAEEICNQSNEAIIGEAAQEKHLLANDPTHDVQLKELETEEIRNIADVETEEVSHQTHAAAVEDSSTENGTHMTESSDQMRSIERTGPEPTLHEGSFASLEEIPTQHNATNEQDIDHREQESVEIQETEAIEPQGIFPSYNVSTSEEFNPEENVEAEEPSSVTQAEESSKVITATEDVESNAALAEEATPEEHVLATEAAVDTPPVQEPEPEEVKNIEAVEAEARDLPAEEMNGRVIDTEAISHESTAASIKELGEDVKINVAFAEEAAPEEHLLQTDAVVDVPSVQEPEQEEVKNTEPEISETEHNITAREPVLEEVKNTEPDPEPVETEHNITAQEPVLEEVKNTEPEPIETVHNIKASDLLAEEMDTEATQTKAIPQESSFASINELTEDDVTAASEPHADIQQVPEQESVEDMNCTDNTEHPGETQQNIACISDELTPTEENTIETNSDTQQVQSLTDQEIKDSEDVKTEEFSDPSVFSTSEEAVQESDMLRSEPASDFQQVQGLDSIEGTRGTEAVETEVDQHEGVSTSEEPVPENNVTEIDPKVGDQHAQEDKSAVEVKETEATETEEISERIDITTSENAAQECTEPGSDRAVQPSQKIELTKDSEDSQPVKEETPMQSNIVTLVDPTTEDSVANETDPPVDINQEHELGSLEEVKDVDDSEAEEASHTGQAVSLDEKSSESNIATAEPTYDIQQVNDMEETEEIKVTEAISGEEICYPQTSTLEDPSPTDNVMAPQEYLVESNEVNLGNETDNVNLVHERIKDEIQESAELKDEAPELDKKTQRGENITEEDALQISSEVTIETSSDINPIEEEDKDSSQMPSDQCEENITHVQDRDIKEENLIARGSAEASQASIENDPHASEDAAEKYDTIKVGENTSDQDNEQLHDVVLQTQVCEKSVDTLVTGQQDEAVKEVLDQQQKEAEEIEKQKEEIQTDEQKHDDKSADFSTETQVETKSIEIGITNRTEDTAFEGEQTDTVVTEMHKSEESQHISEDSIPTVDAMVENITERKEEIEQENGLRNVDSLDASAEYYNKDEQENAEKNEALAKTSISEQDETTGKIRTEEDEPCLASSMERDLQDISDSAPSNDQMQENNPIAVPQNVEYGGHGEDKECTNKVIADVHGIQESEKENVDEVKEKQEMQNEDNDDTTTSCAKINHEKASTHPREIEETEENKGFSAISETVVETSKQNDVDQDLSIHHKIEDGMLGTEHNGVEVEAMQQKVDSSNSETKTASDINQTRQDQEAINANDVQQLEAEENAFDKIETDSIEKMETNYTANTKVVTFNEDICDKASGADGEPSDENLKTLEDTRRNLDVSFEVSASEGESMDKDMEDHKLALPAHPTEEESTNEQAFVLKETQGEFTSPENPLPAEAEEQEENQATKEKDEEDSHEPEIGHTDEEAEQGELPVSHFLMNLILGKESNNLNGNSEAETEKKQQENMKADKTICQQEDLVSFPTETTIDDKFTFEQEKQNVKDCEETHELVKEQNNDFKPDNERSVETDEELNKNTSDLEAPVYHDNAQDGNSSELVSALAAGLVAKMEARDFELHEKAFDTLCQENVEAAKEIEKESLESTQDESTSPKVSQEDALEEGTAELSHESLHEDRSSDAMAEQTLSLTEPDIGDATILPNEADRVQSPPCTKQEEPIESSHVEVNSNTEVQMESEQVEKKEENHHTDIGRDIEEEIETLHDNAWKGTYSEVIADEQVPEITETVSHSEIDLAHEKEIQAGSTSVDEKESYKLSNNEVGNFEKALEIHSDSPNLHVNEHKQDESADSQIVMENNSLPDKPEIDSNLQKQQETDIAQKFPTETETDEEGHKFMVTAEPVIKENVHETVESQMQTVKIKSNEDQEVFDSQVQDRALDVVSPKAASEVEENFVEVTKPEFSTDEEQSPKADESNMAEKKTYDGKIKDEEETKNFTDEVTMTIEERGAGQKASPKKHNILSVVGSKVKHQLAKVKKTIIGKPGNTKSESPKS